MGVGGVVLVELVFPIRIYIRIDILLGNSLPGRLEESFYVLQLAVIQLGALWDISGGIEGETILSNDEIVPGNPEGFADGGCGATADDEATITFDQ